MTSHFSPRVFRAAGIISLAYVVSRVMGYLRESLLAARFGATHTTDAYLVAQDLPASLLAAVSISIVMVFIPVYRRAVIEHGENAAWRLVNVVLNATVLFSAGILAVGWALAPLFVPRLVPGLPADARELATHLTWIMLPMVIFLGMTGVATAVLNANRHFTVPALVGVVSNLSVIAALMVVSQPGQIAWVAWAVVFGAALGTAVQLPALHRAGFRYRAVLDLADPTLARIGQLVIPVMISAAAVQMQGFVDRYMASSLAEGSISALNYAQRINTLPYGVVGVAVATVIYPSLAEYAAAGKLDELRQTMTGGLRTLAWVLLPMATGLFFFREPMIQLFFQRGAFDLRATEVTAQALKFLSPGILFFGWLDVLSRGFFALQDSVTPMWAGLGAVALNVVLNIIFVRAFGLGGLALGTTLSTGLAVAYLLWQLRRRVGSLGMVGLLGSVAVSTVTSVAGGFAGRLVYAFVRAVLPGDTLLSLAVPLAAGLGSIVIVHAALGLLTGNREGLQLLSRMGRKSRRTKQ